MKKFAFLAFEDCAIWQVTLLQKFLKNKGWEMETLSIDGSDAATDGGLVIHADHSIKEADSNHYDLVLLPGGNITPAMIESASLRAFLKGSQGTIAASCASAVLLAVSGLINGPYTFMPQTKEKFSPFFSDGIYTDADICINERIITCKGFAHFEFMMAIFETFGLIQNDPMLARIALKLSKNPNLQ